MTADRRLWFRNRPDCLSDPVCEGVCFDPATGETHFLGDLPALLLSVIDSEPVSVDRLTQRLAGADAIADDDRKKMIGALLFLEAAELVESRFE